MGSLERVTFKFRNNGSVGGWGHPNLQTEVKSPRNRNRRRTAGCAGVRLRRQCAHFEKISILKLIRELFRLFTFSLYSISYEIARFKKSTMTTNCSQSKCIYDLVPDSQKQSPPADDVPEVMDA